MNAAALATPGIVKEIRALLPLFAVSVAAVTLSLAAGKGTPLSLFVYGCSALALGAQSIGQEFSFRTLPLLLSQPIDRRRLYWIKAAVLVPMLVTLGVLATFDFVNQVESEPTTVLLVFAVPILGGLMLAPWLTMICRSPLAGVVFSFGLPASLFTLTMWIVPGPGLQMRVWFALLVALCAFAGVLGWQRFMRLEAIDGTGAAVQFPWPLARTPRPGHPLRMLLLKELRLQQLTFALAAFFIVVWLAIAVQQGLARGSALVVLDILTPLYLALLTVLIGALASAEERQYGTLEAQLLLPVAALRQWMVKVTVVFGLAILLAVALPAILGLVAEAITGRRESFRLEVALAVVLLTAGSLYVSSVSSSGLRAAVVSLAVLPLALAIYVVVMQQLASALEALWPDSLRLGWLHRRLEWIPTLTVEAALVALLVRFAFVNHRSAEPPSERILRQLAILVSVLCGGSVLMVIACRAP